MRAPASAFHPSNLLTYVSLACGTGAVAAAIQASAASAGAFLALAALLDTFDGRFARRFTRSAERQAIGGELDSLVDAVVFGMTPIATIAILLAGSTNSVPVVWWAGGLLYVICALTRLAHFNVVHDHTRFVGLPTPVAALVWSTMLLWGPDAVRSSMVATGLAVAMVAPLPIGRPARRGLSVFASWPVVLVIAHVARL
jgi:CDP-diacylglycerol---serine O-phosphatidyltransferase